MIFLPNDSPLRNPPATLEPKQIVGLDGLRLAFDMLGLAYDRLLDDLSYLTEHRQTSRPDPVRVTSAYLNAWTALDGIYRLRSLFYKCPGLKQTPPLEVELRAMAIVEDLRHGFQHIEGRIPEAVENARPLWGAISWLWSPEDAYDRRATALTLVAGAVRTGYHQFLNPLGRSYFIPIGLVTLQAFGHEVEISALIQRVRRLADGLDKGLRAALPNVQRTGADMLISAEFAFEPDHAVDQEGAT